MTKNQKNLPELLSPCGSVKALDAAIYGGADAVYLGGTAFNARMNARNFDDAAMIAAIYRCHDSGVKLYVTLNTLIYDRQMVDALRYVEFLYENKADALITADLGLSKLIKQYFPDFELHASTQASGHNTNAAKMLYKMGFSRMVCARELSSEDIKTLTSNSPIDIEMFVHGAICVSHSGQCLMSSMIGGRSGNRGECAQPCRLPYNNKYPLSMRDMCLAAHIEEILDSKVASLKIEGRMKPPSYVYAVTSMYRQLLDEGRNATLEEIDSLARVFSRSGFTDGYYIGEIGPKMLGIRSEKDKDASHNTDIRIKEIKREKPCIEIENRDNKLPEKIKFSFKKEKQENIRSARFFNAQSIPDTDFFDIIYLPLEKFKSGKTNGIVLPPVILDSEVAEVEKMLKNAYSGGARHALISNIGHIELVKDIGFTLHGDFRLNLYNNEACEIFEDFADVMLSPELTLPQIRDIGAQKCVIVYGRLPLMLLEKSTLEKSLKDRRGIVFPVLLEFRREIVLNSVPVYMADRQKELFSSGATNVHFIFTVETKSECEKIIDAYKKQKAPEGNMKRIK